MPNVMRRHICPLHKRVGKIDTKLLLLLLLFLLLLGQIINKFNVFSCKIKSPPQEGVDAEPEDEDEDAEEDGLEDLELRPRFDNNVTHFLN